MELPCPPYYTFVSVNSTPPCLPSCPAGLYSEYQYGVLFWVHFTLSIISIVITTATIIPFIFIPERRKFPGTLFIGAFSSILLICFANILLMITRGSWLSVGCRSDHQNIGFGDVDCAIDGAISYIGSMYAVCMCFCITISVLIKTMHFKIPSRIQTISAYVFSTALTGVCVIIMLAKEAVAGQATNGGICFIDPTVNNGWYYEGLWTIPTLIMLIIGTFAIVITFANVIYISFRHGAGFSMAPLLSVIKSQVRLLAFLAVYWYAIITIDTYRLIIRSHSDQYTASATAWFDCLYVTWGGLVENGTSLELADQLTLQNCGFPDVPDFNTLAGISISVSIIIIIYPIIFLLDKVVLEWCWYIIKNRRLPVETEDPATLSSASSSL